MTKNLNGNRGWLNDDAADSLHRIDAELGRLLDVNDAGRSNAYQWELWNLYHSANRPSWLGKPAYPGTSPHEAGNAVDTDDQSWMQAHGGKHGWRRNIASEPWHYIYELSRDTQRPGGSEIANQVTRDRQNFLVSRGWKLVVDGIEGPATRQAYREYQGYLRDRGWYAGAIDGIWGSGTQAAHAKFWAELNPPTPAPVPVRTPDGTAASLRWFGIQKMLKRLYGYRGAVDNVAGSGTIAAFQRFMNAGGYNAGAADGVWGANTAKAAQRWLRAKYGYGGAIDGIFGDGSRAAWARAENANWKAF